MKAPLTRPAGVLAVVALLLVLVTGALAFRSADQVFSTPLTEDGFYSLAVARNVAAGVGGPVGGPPPAKRVPPPVPLAAAAAEPPAGRGAALGLQRPRPG